MNAVATKTTANIAPRIVYCWPTRTPPTPAIRRFCPSMTVVGPAGLATGLGTARGIALGVCVVGVAALVPALAGNLSNAIGPSCVRFTGALGAHLKKIVVRHEYAHVQLQPQAAILVTVGRSHPGFFV